MKVNPVIPDVTADDSRVATISAVGLPLPSSRKLCGCGLPPTEARAQRVSSAVTVTRSTCG